MYIYHYDELLRYIGYISMIQYLPDCVQFVILGGVGKVFGSREQVGTRKQRGGGGVGSKG